ncbi:MAG: HD domain-containing protein [Candidatus Brocadia sp.]
MDERQKRDYQTVVLAGLLHDIGKFLNRADVRRKHPLFSADYVSSDLKKDMENQCILLWGNIRWGL